MGHNHSTQPNKFKLNTKKFDSKLSNPKKTQPNHKNKNTNNTTTPKLISKLKLKLSNSSNNSQCDHEFSNTSINSGSIPIPSLNTTNSFTIKDMMVDMINNKENQTTCDTQCAADYEKFFIKFHQKQQQKTNDILYNTAIQHRIAFISLIGLYESYNRIPTHILFSAIFILKLKREWLYTPQQHKNDSNTLHNLKYDSDDEFLMLLKWKDSQNLLFFMHDCTTTITTQNNDELPLDFEIFDIDDPTTFSFEIDANIPPLSPSSEDIFTPPLRLNLQRNDEVFQARIPPSHTVINDEICTHTMYHQLSKKLRAIYDPFNGDNYQGLILDKTWWIHHFQASQYGTEVTDIIHELNTCEMNYRCVMEILFQSNPSLIPCKSYRELENVSLSMHAQVRAKKVQLDEINNMPSMTVVESTPYDMHWENEFSAECTPCDWICDDYEVIKYVNNINTFQLD